jgi:Fuc2NAc and GlcNAc transferase
MERFIFIMMYLGLSFLAGICGAWLIVRYAYWLGLLDVPNDRSSHNLPTPRGGGVGILVSFTGASLVFGAPTMFWVPVTALSIVSFFDDKLDLSPKIRLIVQFASSLVAVFCLSVSWVSTSSTLLLLAVPLLCVFVVGTANFYNFMDGINGIAGITGMVGLGLVGCMSWKTGRIEPYGIMALSLSAACAGFLPYNIPRAKVFMGDVGSVLLGFTFAALCIALSRSLGDFLVLAGFLFPFYADALSTLFVRWRQGERLSQAHRRHLYQLLANQKRIAHWKVAVGYGIVQFIVGVLFFALYESHELVLLISWGGLLVGWWFVSSALRKHIEVSIS